MHLVHMVTNVTFKNSSLHRQIVMNLRYNLALVGLLILAGGATAAAQEQTVGLFLHDDRAYDGYTLIMPLFHNSSYLIDNDGQLIHSWEHERNLGGASYVLPNGNLLRGSATPNPAINFGGQGGTMQEIDWDGNVVWEFIYSDSLRALHHDSARLPNGNLLMIAWEWHSVEDAVAAGRDTTTYPAPSGAFWPEQIIEVRPTPPVGGEIVWKWHVWDHLIQDFDPTKANYGVVEDHPELIDINYSDAPNGDWLHFNGLNYNAELDQIMISVPGFDELWIIDHSTTTEEAAGHTGGRYGKGGDLLYRWGNPQSYGKGSGADQVLFFNHDTQWVEPGKPGAGNILIFDNGLNASASRVIELAPPVEADGTYRMNPDGSFEAGQIVWDYSHPDFFSGFASGQERQPNGNTLIAETQDGRIFEVAPNGDVVWDYVSPVTNEGRIAQGDSIPSIFPARPDWLANGIFRAYRYPLDYSAFNGKDLTPKGTLELGNPTSIDDLPQLPHSVTLLQNYPNPFHGRTSIRFRVDAPGEIVLEVYNTLGQRVATLADDWYAPGTHVIDFEAEDLASGIYYVHLTTEAHATTRPMTVVR